MHQEVIETTAAQLHPVAVVMSRLSLSRSAVFDLIRTGELRSVKVGRRRLVSEAAIREFVDRIDAASVA